MLLFVLALASVASARVFQRCELAEELRRLEVDEKDIPVWVCIAEKESNFNTSAVGRLNGDGSEDHGIFQISDKYWCSPQGWACNIPCSLLEDDDITDDWKCARRIFKQHKILSGNGFSAWAVYGTHCSTDTTQYVEGCFDNEIKPTEPSTTTTEEEPVRIIETYSAREGNLAEKVQVLDLEMMEKKGELKSKQGKNYKPRRLWQPWTWEI